MIDLTLRETLLPALMFIKGIIKGKNENYEVYLRELINNSAYFLNKSEGLAFTAPPKEDNGECDCNSKNYSLDFKLLGSQSLFYAKSNLSSQIIVDNGVIITTTSKQQDPLTSSILHKVLRHYDFFSETFNNIELEKMYIEDIKYFTKMLLKRKNILFFYPYKMSFENDYTFEIGVEKIVEAFENDFSNAFSYREYMCGDLDTFVSCIYDDQFLIIKYGNKKFEMVDHVDITSSPTYNRMYFEYLF